MATEGLVAAKPPGEALTAHGLNDMCLGVKLIAVGSTECETTVRSGVQVLFVGVADVRELVGGVRNGDRNSAPRGEGCNKRTDRALSERCKGSRCPL